MHGIIIGVGSSVGIALALSEDSKGIASQCVTPFEDSLANSGASLKEGGSFEGYCHGSRSIPEHR